jgi:lipopolysaccharide transport system ATP-binding protein
VFGPSSSVLGLFGLANLMSNIAICVENLSKVYKLGARRNQHDTLRDHLMHGVRSVFSRSGHASSVDAPSDTIRALDHVSFEIKHGDAVGFIGQNGAGKSTLLKILTRITEPTEGRAKIYGRVGSLLEVGTGFNPELSGRENIYLNGAILGMKKAEIERKFDEIVAFSEIDRFIDTPVKRYSSGMYVRLAFAVAAHMETEVLLADEVLAVGDARFQSKCLSKMEDMGRQGRTVIFVSHNLAAVTRLCNRAILMDQGRVLQDGPSQKVAGGYMSPSLSTTAAREWPDPITAPGGKVARLRAVRVLQEDGQIAEAVDIRRPVAIEMEYEVLESGHVFMPHYHICNEEKVFLFSAHDLDPRWECRPRPAGHWVSTAWIPGNLLNEGKHFVSFGLMTLEPKITHFYEADAVSFRITESSAEGTARGGYVGTMGGVVRPALQWNNQFTPNGRVRP